MSPAIIFQQQNVHNLVILIISKLLIYSIKIFFYIQNFTMGDTLHHMLGINEGKLEQMSNS